MKQGFRSVLSIGLVLMALLVFAVPVFAQTEAPIVEPAVVPDLGNAVVNGIPLVFVIFGLVALLKNAGVVGKWLLLSSFGIGVVFGVLYQYSLAPLNGFAAWFGAVIYGLALGLVASGVYEGIRAASGYRSLDEIETFAAEIDPGE